MKDPTASAARRNIESGQKFAVLVFIGSGGQQVYLDADTTRILFNQLKLRPALDGTYYGRLKDATA